MIATEAGTTAPMAVRHAVTRNITHGIRPMWPRTARMATRTSQSTVPLAFAMANR
jgi:hypothetical protein